MTNHNLKLGNVGTVHGMPEIWRIVAIDGDTLTLQQTDKPARQLSTFADRFWCLLDSFD